MSSPVIQVSKLNKSYVTPKGTVNALENIHFNVGAGEIFGVIGKSGAGKSTLIRCLNLLECPTSGSIQIQGKEITTLTKTKLREARRNISMVFQHFNLLSTRTVFQNITFPLEIIGKPKSEIEKTVRPLLKLIGLDSRCDAYPNQLSGGQKQRVAIARALTTQPKVLLCDEMTSSLDPETTLSILNLIKKIRHEMSLSIVLITHEMDVIKTIADTVGVIENGQMIEQGSVVTLFKEPKTETARTFIRNAFGLDIPHEIASHLKQLPLDTLKTQADRIVHILSITFTGQTSTEPMMNNLIKCFKVSINILQAHIESIHNETIGMMLASFWGKHDEIQLAIAHLIEQGIEIKVEGYVWTDDWFTHSSNE